MSLIGNSSSARENCQSFGLAGLNFGLINLQILSNQNYVYTGIIYMVGKLYEFGF